MHQTRSLTTTQCQLIMMHFHASMVPSTDQTILFRAKINGSVMTLYRTGKLLVQGSTINSIIREVDLLLGAASESPQVTISVNPNQTILGTDEVGTGDYFGPIVVCGSIVTPQDVPLLKSLGVKDSKKLTDDAISRMAPSLMKQLKYNAIILSNERFNQAMKQPAMNMNKIKAICHNKVINNLKAKGYSYDAIVVDAFTPQERYFQYLKDQPLIARDAILIEKAEDLYYAVGSSSIIARYLFLNALADLSSSCGYELPKGAGAKVDEMIRKIVEDGNQAILTKIAKTTFKNTNKALEK